MKNIQISEELFSRICTYFLFDKDDPENVQAIVRGLEDKLERMNKRIEYTNRAMNGSVNGD